MEDRDVQFPNRYRLTKVLGTDDIYEVIPAPGEVSQEGSLVNKGLLFSDLAAQLFSLSGDDATPNKAFELIGKNLYNELGNQWIWEKQQSIQVDIPVESSEWATINYYASPINSLYFKNYQFGHAVAVEDGALVLKNIFVPNDHWSTNASSNGAFYSKAPDGKVYKNTEVSEENSTYVANTVYEVTIGTEEKTVTVGYANSDNKDKYPPKEPDGYTYKLMGQLGGKAQMEYGSYVGTGIFGVDNPNSLTFSSLPKILFIFSSGKGTGQLFGIFFPKSLTEAYTQSSYKYIESSSITGTGLYSKAIGNTLYWYGTTFQNQLNSKDSFDYIGIY